VQLHSPSQWFRFIARNTKRALVLVAGAAVVGAGVTMLVMPGPGLLVIIVGLAILATEFAWAERMLDRTTATAATAASKVQSNRNGRLLLALSGLAMIIGGATVATFVGDYRVIGVSVLVAGLIGLATLLPTVQRWIDDKASPRSNVAAEVDDAERITDPAGTDVDAVTAAASTDR
jgi:uncharacterized protein (TIGR02611 family)